MTEEWTHNGKGVVINEQRAGIGKSIVINGELSGGEDLTIDGTVEGKIELRDHVLTVGSNGRIKLRSPLNRSWSSGRWLVT